VRAKTCRVSFVTRRGSAASGLALAATLVLLYDPLLWLNVGFQLSYAVVAALMFYGLPLSEWTLAQWTPFANVPHGLHSRWQRFLLWAQKWFVGSASISAAATLASAPLIVANFHLFSAGSLLANLVIVPMAFPVMLLGFAALALGLVGAGALAVPLNWLAGVNLVALGGVARFASELPGMAFVFAYRVPWAGSAMTLLLLAVFLCVPFGGEGRWRGWLFLLPPALVLASFGVFAG
jgi:competence protein ComEC